MANLKNLTEEFFEAIPKRDFDKIRTLLHPDYSYTGADGERRKGADAGIAVGEMYASAFPDLSIDIQNMHIAGNVVVVEFLGNGTHGGILNGIEPTGKKVQVPVCNVLEFRDGMIYAEREYWDSAVLQQQLGIETPQKHTSIV